jgi:hypothetical protein
MAHSASPLSSFSDYFTHCLNAYALAAGAAGVGVLALAQPAGAKIVYTPAHIPIVQNKGLVELDLNHDGINDFQFSNYTYTEHAKRSPEGFEKFALTAGQLSNPIEFAPPKASAPFAPPIS